MGIRRLATSAMIAQCMALALIGFLTKSVLSNSNVNFSSQALVSLPIDPDTSRDITVRINFGSKGIPMKGGQLLYTIYTLIEQFWYRADDPFIHVPSDYRDSSFPNIDIVVTPTPRESHRGLDIASINYGLLTTTTSLQSRPSWPCSISTRINDRATATTFGLIDISIPTPESRNSSSTSSGGLQGSQHNSTTNFTTAIGDDFDTLSVGCANTEGCPLEQFEAGWPVSEETWLQLFHSIIFKCFVHEPSAKVRDWVPASKTWVRTDRLKKVEMKVQFFSLALSDEHPMSIQELVAGLLNILEQWAQKGDWKTGWGLIERGGETEVTLQIKYITAEDSISIS